MTQETTNFKPLPEGEYLVRMNRIEEKEIKNGGGKMLVAGFQVVNGEHKGRLVFHNFIIEHATSPKAVEIGSAQLDRYLKCIGISSGFEGLGYDVGALQDSLEVPFNAYLKIEDGGGTYRDTNKIVKFSSRG